MTRVELGLHSGHQDIELDEVRKLWREFDKAGIDLITVWDHFYESPFRGGISPTYESTALLSALALETTNCRVGCLCFCMRYRNPAVLAKLLTTVDHLSHGRLTVGLGAGWHVQEHEAYGFNFGDAKERLDRLEESAKIVRSMFTEERTTFKGKYYEVNDVSNFPRPVQEHVPIIIGGGGEKRTMGLAAKYGDGTHQGYMSAESYRNKNKVADEWCERLGRDPKSLERSTLLHFQMSSGPPQARAREGSLWGEPQQVIDQLGAYVDARAQRISISVRPPLDWDAIHSFLEDVVPAFR
jgi:alkanesulfonate monooxygenase SsuD/methylene tetrahydromethanopterin reductase-like flavin-dependent oxidoreductase (luciferase family)